ncbi:MAG: hypothetical protein Q4C98_02710 [Capnocytophaga sp.]|nr:hypothetical protein [Capnocytophaga sp.]
MSSLYWLEKPRGWHWRRSVKKINEMERRENLLFKRGTSELRFFQLNELIFSKVSEYLELSM